MMTWEEFKVKFSRTHVPPGLIKRMRDEFRALKQGRMTIVEYYEKFMSLSRYAPDEIDTEAKKEIFLNGLHDEMQTVLVNIPLANIEALVGSAIQMEGKINQANENRKRRMMHQPGTHHTPKYRPNPSSGFAPRTKRPPMNRPTYHNRGNPRPEGNHNNPDNPNNFNRAPPKFNNNNAATNTNTIPRTGSNVVPVAAKDKSQVTCYECGTKGHCCNECPKKIAAAPNANAPAQQQRRVQPGEGLPQGTLSTAIVISSSCMLKKPKKRQMSCWVCFLLT